MSQQQSRGEEEDEPKWSLQNVVVNILKLHIATRMPLMSPSIVIYSTQKSWCVFSLLSSLTHRAEIKDGDKTLVIKNVVPSDEGVYVCEASNNVGQISSKAQLTVNCEYQFCLLESIREIVERGQHAWLVRVYLGSASFYCYIFLLLCRWWVSSWAVCLGVRKFNKHTLVIAKLMALDKANKLLRLSKQFCFFFRW